MVLLNLLSREQRVEGTSFVITFTIIIACDVKVIFTCTCTVQQHTIYSSKCVIIIGIEFMLVRSDF